MRKYFHGSALFLCILTLCVCGCGGGGSAADPMGTGTVQFIDEKGAVLFPEEAGSPMVFTVLPGETRQLIVWVTNTRDGGATIVPVIGEKVTFSLLTPGNGGSITMVNNETDGNGRAVALYTAGNNFAMDEVRVTTGVGATAHVTIMKQGGMTGSSIATLSAASPAVAAGHTTLVTAYVTDGYGHPVMGETVTFTIPVNESGASFINDSGAGVSSILVATDISGKAVAIYRAGSNDALAEVYDTVRGALANGSMNWVTITRSAGTVTAVLSVEVVANPTSVGAGQTSIITAIVTGDDRAGAAVTFSLPVNSSGASFINASGAGVPSITVTANGSGVATAIYRAGSASPGTEAQDTILAVLTNGANGAVILTRSSTTPSTYTVKINASSTIVTAGQVSIITAEVTIGSEAAPAAGVPVTFTLPVNSSGATLSAATATTDGSGKAVVIYLPGTTSPTLTVQDTVQAAVGTATSAVAITRVGSATSAFNIMVSAAPETVSAAAGGSSVITANVMNNAGTPISGVTVDFTTIGGTLTGGGVAASATTDGSGNAVTVFTAAAGPADATAGVVTASISIGLNPYTAAVVITYE